MIGCKFCGVAHEPGKDGCSGYPNPGPDPTTRRAEEIREETGMAWERACLQAERERDDDDES